MKIWHVTMGTREPTSFPTKCSDASASKLGINHSCHLSTLQLLINENMGIINAKTEKKASRYIENQ